MTGGRPPARTAGIGLLAGAALAAAGLGALLASADAAPAPEPERGVAVVLEPVSGDVLVHRDGVTRYRRLRAAERMPVGTTVDAQEGGVRLIVASDDDGGTSRAVFSDGKFTVTQAPTGDPVTTLKLTGPSLRDTCGAASASGRKRKRVRRLWGDGHGSFRTAGHYSAATVRGTRWLTEDRCDGTLTRVLRGTVEVEDFTVPPPQPTPTPEPGPLPPEAPAPSTGAPEAGANVLVPAGGSYVARPGG
jgi:hypothetical protein